MIATLLALGVLAGGLEFVAGAPGDGGGGGEGLPAEVHAEAGELGVGGEIHIGGVVVVGGVVAVGGVVVFFGEAPGGVVTGEEGALADGEGRDADAGEGEVVGAVVVAGLGVGVGDDGEVEALCGRLDGGEEAGALGAGDVDLQRVAEGLYVVVVEVEGDISAGTGGCWPRYSEPRRPCSSAVTEAKMTVCGGGVGWRPRRARAR